ncbi:MAG: alkaline phosphatase D family protein [Bacteroidia bacterium]|nr:alkaline phosphatase D family protein [Bacteroidia bacterium]
MKALPPNLTSSLHLLTSLIQSLKNLQQMLGVSRLSYPIVLLLLCMVSADSFTQAIGQENPSLNDYPEPVDLYDASMKPFYHGVASGDPLSDRVIIWTRITPDKPVEQITVEWIVAADKGFDDIIKKGSYTTHPGKDYTVKIDVDGLAPNSTYYYQFTHLESRSIIGRTKTLPVGDVSRVKLAVSTCSNYEGGFFNAYAAIAKEDVDAVVHLGDYIYEYETGHYGLKELIKDGRHHRPITEIIKLPDYRQRYSLYRTDKMLQAVHQNHPFITIWDDHETANNSHNTGAENHQVESEGNWEARKQMAQTAYFEWMPIRDNKEKNIYRSFNFGNLMKLIMVDTRIIGRSPQVANMKAEDYLSEERTLLGDTQRQWLTQEMKDSTTWKIIGNQVMVSPMDVSFFRFLGVIRIPFYPGKKRNMDQWDGYPAAKDRVMDFIKREGIQNVVFLTGDDHASYAYEVAGEKENPIEAYQNGTPPLAVELVTPSISSANFDEYLPRFYLNKLRRKFPKKNPHLQWFDLTNHGYISLEITPEATTATWNFMESIREINDGQRKAKTLQVKAGSNKLE